jgi:CDP-4-dehydro-6-deoxyglucose reductase, E3
MHALCEEWATTLPGFRYVPVVSDAAPEDNWSGRSGFVHRAVMADFPDLWAHQVYACGAPVMVDSAKRDVVGQCGLPEEVFTLMPSSPRPICRMWRHITFDARRKTS